MASLKIILSIALFWLNFVWSEQQEDYTVIHLRKITTKTIDTYIEIKQTTHYAILVCPEPENVTWFQHNGSNVNDSDCYRSGNCTVPLDNGDYACVGLEGQVLGVIVVHIKQVVTSVEDQIIVGSSSRFYSICCSSNWRIAIFILIVLATFCFLAGGLLLLSHTFGTKNIRRQSSDKSVGLEKLNDRPVLECPPAFQSTLRGVVRVDQVSELRCDDLKTGRLVPKNVSPISNQTSVVNYPRGCPSECDSEAGDSWENDAPIFNYRSKNEIS